MPMGIVYLGELGGMEAFKITSFHATPTGIMLTFGKNAGYAYPPPPTSATPMRIPDANPHSAGVPGQPCHPEFSRIAKKKTVEGESLIL